MTIQVQLTDEQYEGLRWTNSPLRHALDDLAAVSEVHTFRNGGAAIGNNLATKRVVGTAQQLTEIVVGIRMGLRDGMGYPK